MITDGQTDLDSSRPCWAKGTIGMRLGQLIPSIIDWKREILTVHTFFRAGVLMAGNDGTSVTSERNPNAGAYRVESSIGTTWFLKILRHDG